MSREDEREKRPAWLEAVVRHPLISAVLVVCTLGGALAGVWFLDPDWSLARRALAGAVGGAGIGLVISATKMVGQ